MATKMVNNVFDKGWAYWLTIGGDRHEYASIGRDARGVSFEIGNLDGVKVKKYYTDRDALEKRMREVSSDGKLNKWAQVNYYSVRDDKKD